LCPRCAPPARIPTELNGTGRHSTERGSNKNKAIKGNRKSCLAFLIALNKFESGIARWQPPELQTVCFSSSTLCPSCAPAASRAATASSAIDGDRCACRIVVLMLACPSNFWMAASGTRRMTKCDANVCRSDAGHFVISLEVCCKTGGLVPDPTRISMAGRCSLARSSAIKGATTGKIQTR